MQIRFFLYFSISVFLLSSIFAEGDLKQIKCEMKGENQLLTHPINGRYKPARTGPGEYFRVLITFAQFASDTKPDNKWPLNQLPLWKDDLIDTSVSKYYPNGYRDQTLSDYFDKASFGKLNFIGDTYQNLIIVPKDMYYADANFYVLKELSKNIHDFRRYDKWKYHDTTFAFAEGNGIEDNNDRYVDMIIIIYRNANESVFKLAGGISELGLAEDFVIDSLNNIKVAKSNFLYPMLDYRQGGITTRSGLSDKFSLIGHLAHEFGHYLFGEEHSYMGGLMAGAPYLYESGTFMMNAWERAFLGYINFKIAISDGEQDTLRDFVKYGDALRINLPNNNICYIVENHQRLSNYDQIMRGEPLNGEYIQNTTIGSGIYIWSLVSGDFYHYPPVINLKSADGAWDWKFDGTYYAYGFYANTEWKDTVPKLKRIFVNRNSGTSDRDPLKIKWHGQWFPKWVDTNPFTGEYELTRDVMGEDNDAFNIGYNNLFTPWSNPSSYLVWENNFSLELVNKYGNENNYILRTYSTRESALALPPSKPTNLTIDQNNPYVKLTWDSNIEPDVMNGGSYIVYKSSSIDGHYLPIGNVIQNKNSGIQMFIDTTYPGKINYYYKIAAVDNTKKISVLSDAVLKKPNFTNSQETWSGDITITGNINIPAGKMLVIKEGTKIDFKNLSHLSVDGKLIIAGTDTSKVVIDFNSISVSPANCIYANPGSTVYMYYTEIKNAGLAIYAIDAEVQINHCNFHDLNKPVFFCNVLYNNYNSFIKNTSINNSLSEGVWLNNSSIYLENNKITNCQAEGLRLSNESSPILNGNTIQNSYYGITAVDNCTISLLGYNSISNYTGQGIALLDHSLLLANNGFNSIQIPGNGYYYIDTKFYCDAQVRYNYWFSDPPDINNFQVGENSMLNYNNWLSAYPNAGSTLPKITESSNLESAYAEFTAGNYIDAEKLFVNVIKENIYGNESHYAITGLASCYNKRNNGSFIRYLDDELKLEISNTQNSLYKEYLELSINYLIQEGLIDSALTNIELILNKFKLDSECRKELEFRKGILNLVFKNDVVTANSIFEQIKKDHTDKRTNNDVEIILSTYNSGAYLDLIGVNPNHNINEIVGHKVEIPDKYELNQNYPNPFNPMTTIKYALPQNSYVVLDVYNLIGERVLTLVNDVKNAGYYEVVFEGRNFSSGVYIYRIMANSLESSKNFVKTSKMILIK